MNRIIAMSVLALVVAACGQAGDADSQTESPETTTSSVATTTTQPPATTTTDETPTTNTTEAVASEDEPAEDLNLDPDLPAIEVIMTEMAFEPSTFAVSAGETVQFVLRNEGAVEHEFRLTTQHAAEEHIASGHEDHGDEEDGHGHDEMSVTVQPGDVTVFTVTFEEAGVFDTVACLLPGHFEAGMHAPLTYES